MAGHTDSESENSYSDEAEFEEKESETYSASPMKASGFMVVARAPLCVLFAAARKCHMESSRVAPASEWEVS